MHFRVAQRADASVIAGVLSSAGTKLLERGEALWSTGEVSQAAVTPHIERGLYHVGFDAQCAVGVFRLQFQDPAFWPEIPEGTSAYLHKLAILPEKQAPRLRARIATSRGHSHTAKRPAISSPGLRCWPPEAPSGLRELWLQAP